MYPLAFETTVLTVVAVVVPSASLESSPSGSGWAAAFGLLTAVFLIALLRSGTCPAARSVEERSPTTPSLAVSIFPRYCPRCGCPLARIPEQIGEL
jgi:hypothetical protein